MDIIVSSVINATIFFSTVTVSTVTIFIVSRLLLCYSGRNVERTINNSLSSLIYAPMVLVLDMTRPRSVSTTTREMRFFLVLIISSIVCYIIPHLLVGMYTGSLVQKLVTSPGTTSYNGYGDVVYTVLGDSKDNSGYIALDGAGDGNSIGTISASILATTSSGASIYYVGTATSTGKVMINGSYVSSGITIKECILCMFQTCVYEGKAINEYFFVQDQYSISTVKFNACNNVFKAVQNVNIYVASF